MLQPDDVARATIGLLCSPLTGQVLDVRRGEPVGETGEAQVTGRAARATKVGSPARDD